MLFVAAGIAAVLALTPGLWLPAIPRLFGLVEANSEAIGTLADVVQVVDTVVTWGLWAATALLTYLGLRRLDAPEGGGGTTVENNPKSIRYSACRFSRAICVQSLATPARGRPYGGPSFSARVPISFA